MSRLIPGNIISCDLGSADRKAEERGRHYAVVISTELHNTVNRTVIVVPLTHNTKHAEWHEHFKFDIDGTELVAMCQHIRELDKSFINGDVVGQMGTADYEQMMKTLMVNTLQF